MPWKILATNQEAERLESLPWVQERFARHRAAMLRTDAHHVAFPMVERDRRLVCIFLDADNLCSVYKAGGRDLWPRTCKAFPFEFIEDEAHAIRASLSHLCPSIRDSYGEPLEKLVESYQTEDSAPAERFSSEFTLAGRPLAKAEAVEMIRAWESCLDRADDARTALLGILDFHLALVERMGAHAAAGETDSLDLIREVASDQHELPDAASLPSSSSGRLLTQLVLALSLSVLAYPLRASQAHGWSWRRSAALLRICLRLIQGKGEVDLLFASRPFELANVRPLASPADDPALRPEILRYFRQAVWRRNLFTYKRDLLSLGLDLILAHTIICRIARCRAASEHRSACQLADVREGISAAEVLVLNHFARQPKPAILETLIGVLAANRRSAAALLADA